MVEMDPAHQIYYKHSKLAQCHEFECWHDLAYSGVTDTPRSVSIFSDSFFSALFNVMDSSVTGVTQVSHVTTHLFVDVT